MNPALLKKRARLIQETRNFFINRDYLEVDTPILAPFLIPEPSIEVFETRYIDPSGSYKKMYLIPSPEIWMKRLIGEGLGSIFQITKSFRNVESLERYHNPEFTLLEWYTMAHSYLDSIEMTESLLSHLSKEVPFEILGPPPYPRISIRQIFREAVDLELDDLMDSERLQEAADELGIRTSSEDTWEVVFNRIFLTHVEPGLKAKGAIFLLDYPKAVPTLARSEGGYAQRWELYINGIEIANCYTEETSTEEIKVFFDGESRRKKDCLVHHKIDPHFPELFDKDYPECSGVALGIDRLFMVLSGLKSIDRVISFPFSQLLSL